MIFPVIPFFPKTWYFFFGRKMTFLKKYVEIWYFLYVRAGLADVAPSPCTKKIKDDLIPQNYT